MGFVRYLFHKGFCGLTWALLGLIVDLLGLVWGSLNSLVCNNCILFAFCFILLWKQVIILNHGLY